MKELTVAISQGLYVIGTEGEKGTLYRPRVLRIMEQPAAPGSDEMRTTINLTPLPGVPAEVSISAEGSIWYQMPYGHNKKVYELYSQVTADGVDPNAGN